MATSGNLIADVPARPRVLAFVALTKPRVIELLLVTTVPTMFLAADGFPDWRTLVATLVGGALAAGGANALNCWIDADIDAVMTRTAHRPTVTGEISRRATFRFGLLLSVVSILVLAVFTNALAAALAFGAIAFYVLVYTVLLKRRTAQNIVWGGAAGCFPVLIGWSAVTGSLEIAPFVLFMIVFLWTPPHYWPLSMKYEADYEAARIPMLPVVAPAVEVGRQTVVYSWAMVGFSLLLIPAAGAGVVYGSVATISGAVFLREAYGLRRRAKAAVDLQPMRLFHYSITYLSLLFLAIGVDPFLR
jgi:protoheme IX farnesyltransferase